ncbi:MAG: response regulator transcription factor [Chloroflexi bacterium]|nr:response regulator transcription factor [Chloroflexota bacterium]
MLDLLRTTFDRDGMLAIEAGDGYAALERVREHLPDLVILDVMMPGMDGFETLKEIRLISNVPVIMLTVDASERSRVRGLELGADDYIAKPFSHRELLSRVKAVLRRTRMAAPLVKSRIDVDADLSIDFDKREVIARGERVKLRPTEYKLLYHLASNAGRLMTHESLLSRVWGREYRDDTQLLRLYVTYLRQKIEKEPSRPKYILNERGIGYRFAEF